jgi:hypothetical protein
MPTTYCIGAGVFGLLMGYLFAWSSRQVQPTGNEVAALVSTVLGGTVLSVLNQIDCAARLPIYMIGVAAGYALYIFLLSRNWARVQHFIVNHGLQHTPFIPSSIWRMADPCCSGSAHPNQK